jgi:transposase
VGDRNAGTFSLWQTGCQLGLVSSEESSGDRRRLGHISKQGNVLLGFLLVEAAQVMLRSQPERRSHFFLTVPTLLETGCYASYCWCSCSRP